MEKYNLPFVRMVNLPQVSQFYFAIRFCVDKRKREAKDKT